MKKYQKVQLIAKNLPTGSYAAGCPANLSFKETRSCIVSLGKGMSKFCQECERAK